MLKPKFILLAPALFFLMLCASKTEAQVTATANVLLTVVPAPGIEFETDRQKNASLPIVNNLSGSGQGSITFQSSSNVTVKLKSRGAPAKMLTIKKGEVHTFTIKELKNISKIEVLYTGS